MVDLVLRHLPIRPAEALGRLARLGSRRRRPLKPFKLGRAEPARTVQDVVESWGKVGTCQRRYCGSLVEDVAETPQPCPTDRDILFEANDEDLDIEFVLRRDFQEDECEDCNALRCIDSAQFSDITLLAQGGFGSIYTATWKRPGKTDLTVALKVFNGDDVNEALFDKLSELSRCRYLYFPHLFGITKLSAPAHAREDARALVMQYYPDGDLGTLLAEESDAISWKWRLNILRHTCAALSRAHDLDVLHCNLHSGNILVERLRTIVLGRVADFGLSRVFNDKNHSAGSYGIVPYMAPELLRGKRHSKATDIYALGMIMWELSAGRSPFSDCAHDIDLMLRICDGERPPIVVGTPDCWVQLMKRCWDQDPDQRPTAKKVYEELITWIRFRRNYNVKAIIQFEEAEEQRRQSPALLLSTGWHPQAARAGKWVPSTEMISEHCELISDDDWEEALASMM